MTRLAAADPVDQALTLTREVAILRRHVFCAGCGKHMSARDQYVYDHENPLEVCGRDEPGDMRPLCHECDDVKTPKDQSLIAKLKRLAGETCTGPTQRPIPTRPDGGWPPRGSRKLRSGNSLRKDRSHA